MKLAGHRLTLKSPDGFFAVEELATDAAELSCSELYALIEGMTQTLEAIRTDTPFIGATMCVKNRSHVEGKVVRLDTERREAWLEMDGGVPVGPLPYARLEHA